MKYMKSSPLRLLASTSVILACLVAGATTVETYSAKLATLRERGANPRIQKAVAILAEAEAAKLDPVAACTAAIEQVKMKSAAGELTKAALLRNLDIARKLGCLNDAGLADMRRGQSPTIKRGPYKDDELSVDHIIPRAVCPELDNVIANLELMPLKLNQKKRTLARGGLRDTLLEVRLQYSTHIEIERLYEQSNSRRRKTSQVTKLQIQDFRKESAF